MFEVDVEENIILISKWILEIELSDVDIHSLFIFWLNSVFISCNINGSKYFLMFKKKTNWQRIWLWNSFFLDKMRIFYKATKYDIISTRSYEWKVLWWIIIDMKFAKAKDESNERRILVQITFQKNCSVLVWNFLFSLNNRLYATLRMRSQRYLKY